jgi:hypothetical protein
MLRGNRDLYQGFRRLDSALSTGPSRTPRPLDDGVELVLDRQITAGTAVRV